MAAVVYEGKVGGEGMLFAGMKFFVMQRVPLRETYLEAITKNGGKLVKLDKHADVIIADHARKNNPMGSISWTFIDRSVARGRLEDPEDHRAGPKTHTVREVGSAQPPRSGRTPFTAQDDRDLLIWVTKAERNGVPLKGNDPYQQLEQINPRHTFQSWRDRWIKQLAHRTRPELSEEEILAAAGNPTVSKFSNHQPPARPHRLLNSDDEAAEVEPASTVEQETRARVRPNVARVKPPAPQPAKNKPNDETVAARSSTIVPLRRLSTGGMNFTEAETAHMLDYYDVMAEASEKKGVTAWAKYSVENSNHSAQEWHNYFVQTIKPLVEKRRQESKSPSPNLPEASASKRKHPEASTREESRIETQSRNVVDPSTEDEKLFIEDLSALAEDNDYELNFEPIICGRKIPLFRLWQVVNSVELGGYDVVNGRGLWTQVARKLNFHEFKHADAPEAIKSAYEVILPDFEVAREEYLAALQDEAMIESQFRATAERDSTEEDGMDGEFENVTEEEQEEQEEKEEEEDDDYDDDLEAPASVPRHTQSASSNKRRIGSISRINQDGSPVLGTYNKRQRIGEGKGKKKEVPSTPEVLINTDYTPRQTYKSSPIHLQQLVAEGGSDSEEDLPLPQTKFKFPAMRQLQRNLEPETQDFNFPPVEKDFGSQTYLPNRRKEKNGKTAAPSSLHEDSSTQSQTDSQKEQQLIAFIDHHVALGYPQIIVIRALESTNMTIGNALATFVMEELMKGNEIPDNMQGVWTAADDAALADVESEEFERVAMKHKTKGVVLRQKFLDEQREAQKELGTG